MHVFRSVSCALLALVLAACTERGERHRSEGYDLHSAAALLLTIDHLNKLPQTEVCAGFLRSARHGKWMGEWIETWWELGAKESIWANGLPMREREAQRPGAGLSYCVLLPAAPSYAIEWRDEARGRRVRETIQALSEPIPTLEHEEGERWILRWQPDPPGAARLRIDVEGSVPSLRADERLHQVYSEAPNRGPMPIADGVDHMELRLHPDTQAIRVSFSKESTRRGPVLGFRSPGTVLNLYGRNEVRLELKRGSVSGDLPPVAEDGS